MAETADEDGRVLVTSASDEEGVCPECGRPFTTDEWPVALDTEKYEADVTHECPNGDCDGAASAQY